MTIYYAVQRTPDDKIIMGHLTQCDFKALDQLRNDIVKNNISVYESTRVFELYQKQLYRGAYFFKSSRFDYMIRKLEQTGSASNMHFRSMGEDSEIFISNDYSKMINALQDMLTRTTLGSL